MQSTIRFWNADGSELLYEANLLPTEKSSYSVSFYNYRWTLDPTKDSVGHTLSQEFIHFISYYKTENNSTSNIYIDPTFNNLFKYKGNYVRCVGFSNKPNQDKAIIGDVTANITSITIDVDVYDFYAVYNYQGFKRYFLMQNNDVDYCFTDQPTNYKLEYAIAPNLYGTIIKFYFLTDTESSFEVDMSVTPKITTHNQHIRGVSVKPNDVDYITYTSKIYELYPNTTKFYVVFSYITESVDNSDYLELFRYNSEHNRVGKIEYLEEALNEEGVNVIRYQMRESCNIIRPTITIALKLGGQYNRTSIDFNYVYIPDLNRYYYVENYTYITNNLVELNLRIDVLMTYREGIYKLDGFIDRNEFLYNPEIVDTKQVVMCGYTTKTTEVETSIFQPMVFISDDGSVTTVPTITYAISGNGLSLDVK